MFSMIYKDLGYVQPLRVISCPLRRLAWFGLAASRVIFCVPKPLISSIDGF